MRIKKSAFIAYIIAFSLSANSQTSIGVKGGFGINNLTGSTNSEKALIAIQASAFAKIAIGNLISLQPSLGYYPKGKKRLNESIEDELGFPTGTGDVTLRIDYIELASPFQFMFDNGNIQWLVGLGPFFSYAVGGRKVYKNVSGLSSEPKNGTIVFGENGANRADAGLTVLFSAILHSRWIFSLNYDQGLTNNDYYAKEKTISVGMSIGYFFK